MALSPSPEAASLELADVLRNLASQRKAALDRLFQFLAIPSISTDPAYHCGPYLEAADWCADTLSEIGFAARVERTAGKPMVVGHWRADGGAPFHVLFYGQIMLRAAARSPGAMDRPAVPASPRRGSETWRHHHRPWRLGRQRSGHDLPRCLPCLGRGSRQAPRRRDRAARRRRGIRQPSLPTFSRAMARSSKPTSASSATRANGTPIRRRLPPFCVDLPSPRSP